MSYIMRYGQESSILCEVRGGYDSFWLIFPSGKQSDKQSDFS